MQTQKQSLKLVSIHISNSPQAMGLATAMLKSQLDSEPDLSKTLNIERLDYYLDDDNETIIENIINTLRADEPAWIGFSLYIWNRQKSITLAKKIKAQQPGVIIFAGGAEASADPASLLKDGPFDFIIKGEAELTLTQVMKQLQTGKPLEQIPGVHTRHNVDTKVVDAPLVIDLESLASPFLNGEINLQMRKGLLWELSRGCRFHCTFCYEGLGVKTVRNFPLDRIRAELELFESNQVEQIFVLDPVFNLSPERTRKILGMIREIAPQIHFIFEVRAEFLTEEIADLFSQIHCSLQIGLQSSNPDALKAIRRNFNLDKYSQKISLLNQYGVPFGLDLIYGLPKDTFEDFKQSLDLAIQFQPNQLDIFPLSVLPGTELNEERQNLKLERKEEAPYTLVSSPTFSKTDMEKAAWLSEAVDLFYNQGMGVPWFFMVLETLNVKPSDLFSTFYDWLVPWLLSDKQHNLNLSNSSIQLKATEILAYQKEFLKLQFDKNGQSQLFSVLSDLMTYHFALNQALIGGSIEDKKDNEKKENNQNSQNSPNSKKKLNLEKLNMEKKRLRLTPGVQFITLKYRPENLMTLGEYTFEEFLEEYQVEQTSLLVYNDRGEVLTELLEPHQVTLLTHLLGEKSIVSALCSTSEDAMEQNEVKDFMNFCLHRNILRTV